MYSWIPDTCRELRVNLVETYWIMLVPFALFMMVFEHFKMPEQGPDMTKIIKRVFISIVLLITFDECLNLIAVVGEGLADKIGGLVDLKNVLDTMLSKIQQTEVSWLKFKESLIYVITILSYIIAYLGVFIADALIHFVWAILYIVSPLMILMYVSDKTAAITSNLYRSLMTVMVWKVLWSILAVLLLKMASNYILQGHDDNFMTIILMNLFVGLSMLFIPMTTKSLLTDGFSGLASGFAAIGAGAIAKVAAPYAQKIIKAPGNLTRSTLDYHNRQIRSRLGPKQNTPNPPTNGGNRGK